MRLKWSISATTTAKGVIELGHFLHQRAAVRQPRQVICTARRFGVLLAAVKFEVRLGIMNEMGAARPTDKQPRCTPARQRAPIHEVQILVDEVDAERNAGAERGDGQNVTSHVRAGSQAR